MAYGILGSCLPCVCGYLPDPMILHKNCQLENPMEGWWKIGPDNTPDDLTNHKTLHDSLHCGAYKINQ
jgi:hypothetical protein